MELAEAINRDSMLILNCSKLNRHSNSSIRCRLSWANRSAWWGPRLQDQLQYLSYTAIHPTNCAELRGTSPWSIGTLSQARATGKDTMEVENMRHLLLTMACWALYAKRKCTVETVFGIINGASKIPILRAAALRLTCLPRLLTIRRCSKSYCLPN